MSKSKNERIIVLSFINGEPYLYNKNTKIYTILQITLEEAFKIFKENFDITLKRPNMKNIFEIIALNIEECEGYSPYFNKRNKVSPTSFESILTKEITKFLNEIYPPEKNMEMIKKLREYSDYKRQNTILSNNAKKRIKENQMKLKRGRKLY